MMQEGALTAMASVADCAKAHFIRYYDSVMPLLSHLLTGATADSHKLLWAKSLECISLVGMAVGRERFRSEAHNVMRCMQQLQARILSILAATTKQQQKLLFSRHAAFCPVYQSPVGCLRHMPAVLWD